MSFLMLWAPQQNSISPPCTMVTDEISKVYICKSLDIKGKVSILLHTTGTGGKQLYFFVIWMNWSFKKKGIKQRLWMNNIIYTKSSSWVLPGIQSQNKSQANLDVRSAQRHKQSRKQGSRGQIPGLKSQVLSYNERLHSLLPQPLPN